jgi:uncharacterized protein (TIRG00374 family)
MSAKVESSAPSPKRLFPILRGLLALFLLISMIWWVSPSDLIEVFWNITPLMLGYLLLISFVLIYVSVLKWQVLLEAQGRFESSFRLYRLYLVGYFVNLLFPSFVGGDAVRSWYLGKQHGQREAAAATFLERYSGLVAMIVLGCVFMWGSSVVEWHVRLTIASLAVFFVGVSIFLLTPTAVKSVATLPKIGATFAKQGMLFQAAVRLGMSCPKRVGVVFVYSFLFHCLAVVNVLACAMAVGWLDVPLYDLFVVLPVILILSAIPLTPQGLGIQEGAFVYYLTQLGATSAEALGVALIIRAKAYFLAILGGGCLLYERASTERT